MILSSSQPAAQSQHSQSITWSLFECVLREHHHHDVRTISAMMLGRIADASAAVASRSRQVALLSRLGWEQLASAKQCMPGQRSNRGPAGPEQAFRSSHARALPRTDGLQTGMVSLLAKAAALHAPCGQALQALPMDSP